MKEFRQLVDWGKLEFSFYPLLGEITLPISISPKQFSSNISSEWKPKYHNPAANFNGSIGRHLLIFTFIPFKEY
jgi:hypothetical protein